MLSRTHQTRNRQKAAESSPGDTRSQGRRTSTPNTNPVLEKSTYILYNRPRLQPPPSRRFLIAVLGSSGLGFK